jgi:hypothetical protein
VKPVHGTRPLWFVVLYLGLLLAAGCTTSTTVVPGRVTPAEPPPPAVETPFEPPPPLGPIRAPGQIRELMPGGAVDWSDKTVAARGTGVLDPGNSDRDQAWQLAERAATVVAQRNLLEIVKDVRVDSDTRVRDYVAERESAYQRLEDVVKGAQPRHPARRDSIGGTVEVELECNLYGDSGVAGALMPQSAAGPRSGNISGGGLSRPAVAFLRQYSGLILDAGAIDLKPALFPRIYDESGALLLDPREYLTYAGEPGTCAVQYVGSLGPILARPEFGQPLVLKVKEARNKLGADIVLARGDADMLKGIKDGLEFLIDSHRILIKLAL